MASTLRSIAMVGLALAAPLALASCGGDDDGGGGTGVETVGTIAVTVRVDGDTQSGIPVELYEPGAATATTTVNSGGNGVATFSNVEAGTWEVAVVTSATLELDAGEEARKSATVTEGQTSSVSFDLVDTFQGSEVSAVNLAFNPSNVTINTGESVRWVNEDAEAHNVTPSGGGWSGGSLGSQGSTVTETFDAPGTYDYTCTLHTAQNMSGTITVVDP